MKIVLLTGKKHWEKEKLLITSNFSFSHSVFKRPLLQTRKNQACLGKGWYTLVSLSKVRFVWAFSPRYTMVTLDGTPKTSTVSIYKLEMVVSLLCSTIIFKVFWNNQIHVIEVLRLFFLRISQKSVQRRWKIRQHNTDLHWQEGNCSCEKHIQD